MESRLREEVLQEVQRSGGGYAVVNHETEEGQVYHALERVHNVQTPAEVFQMLQVTMHDGTC